MKSKIKKKKKLFCLWRFKISIILLWFPYVIVDSGDAFINYNAIDISSLSSDC